MNNKNLVACVGANAVAHRIQGDLHIDPRDRRIIRCQTNNDVDRLQGYRDIAMIDMGASWYQLAFCQIRGFRKVTVEEARTILHG